MPSIDPDPRDPATQVERDLARWLAGTAPDAAPRPAFAAELGARFVAQRRARPLIGRALGRPRRALVWPALALGAAAALILSVRGPEAPATAPPPLPRAELVARNAAAWRAVEDVAGTFVDARGRRVEEWVRFRPDGAPLFRKHLVGASDVPGVREQWSISDGTDLWIVDGADGAVHDAALDGTLREASALLQCARLALPPDLADGPAPSPGVVDGHRAYRLEATRDGALTVYWIDAADHLVRRIDDAEGRTTWRRGALRTNAGLRAEDFRPDNLSGFGG